MFEKENESKNIFKNCRLIRAESSCLSVFSCFTLQTNFSMKILQSDVSKVISCVQRHLKRREMKKTDVRESLLEFCLEASVHLFLCVETEQ